MAYTDKTKPSDEIIKICTELHVEDSAAITAAVEERPDNVVTPLMAMGAPDGVPAPAVEMAVVVTKLWRPGRVLKISFVGTIDPTVKQKIQAYAAQWLQYANLKFEFVGSSGDIRIATTPGGSWSYIGTDAKTIAMDKPTMNFGWFNATTPDKEFSRVILHEFGHALGAIHEHQHPQGGIPWDKPEVYAYYARQGWDKTKVDQNIFAKYAANQLNLTSYDKASIMHYAVPEELTLGTYSVGWNTVLSANDKKLAKTVYPSSAAAAAPTEQRRTPEAVG
jgi:serralysin